MSVPNLTYTISHYKYDSTSGTAIEETFNSLESVNNLRCSYNDPYNKLKITFISTNCSLSYHEVRITAADAEYGIGIGTRWDCKNGGLAANTTHTYTYDNLPVNQAKFGQVAGLEASYRIGLYAKSQADGLWDVKYLFLTTESDGSHKIYAPSDYDGIMVIADDPIPTI